MQKHTIDAKGQVPGRIATQVAVLLMGKNRTDFARNVIPNVEVSVVNASQMKFDLKKLNNKTYARHSLYPGGLTLEKQSEVIAKKGAGEVLRRAVLGMLPKNKLRPQMIKNLKITD